MAEKRAGKGRVRRDVGGAALAAVELMKQIAAGEMAQSRDREYWFRLYQQCLKAVQGESPKQILAEK